MKLSSKSIVIIFAFILITGVFITGQLLGRTKVVKNNDKPQVSVKGDMQLLNPKVDKSIPDLKGGPEVIPSPPAHTQTASQVFYNSKNRKLKQIALTFDDGPDAYYTPQILDILKQYNIKATFFIIGVRAEAHPEIVHRIFDEGHSIGNHTWDHPLMTKIQADKVQEEVDKTEEELYKITGVRTAMFRPPYGALAPQQVKEISSMGYNIIDWSVDTRDWAKTPTPEIMKFVSKEVYPGGIILQHCAGGKNEDLSNTVKALPEIINLLEKQGYSFVPVQDILGIPSTKNQSY